MRESTMTEPDQGKEERELKARLERLSSALDSKRSGSDESQDKVGSDVVRTGQAMSLGFRVLAEFVSGVAVGGLIGWQLDVWMGTEPFGLIVFLFMGTIAGFWNVYRIAMRTTSR
jgi:ATP synthase protein I